MTEERKQEQQHKAMLAFANAYVSDTVFTGVRIKDDEAGARAMERLRRAMQKQARAEQEEKIKVALCSPYGRFFNEGTD